MEKQTGSKLGKEYVKAIYCHPAYFTFMQSTSSKMLGWVNHKLESRLLGEIWTSSDLQMMPPLMAESEAELKNLLMRVKVCTYVFSVMSDSATPWTTACQSPLSMEFSRQEYWSGFPFLSTGDLPNPGIEPMSPAFTCKFFITVPPEDERRE